MSYEYNYNPADKSLTVSHLKDFDIKQTIECGQCFRWEKENDGSYTIQAFSKTINVKQTNEYVEGASVTLVFSGTSLSDFENLWISYFDLERDYGEIKNKLLKNDKIIEDAIQFGAGMRLLNQDEWETLVSFLISQNSNIPRIKKAIKAVCENFGEPYTAWNGKTYYTFPEAKQIHFCENSEEKIEACRLGYRTSYIYETARVISKDQAKRLYNLKNESFEEAYEYLLKLKGVGPKVANCVMLFSMEKYESFPIDVWVKRVMSKLYMLDEKDLKGIEKFGKDKFGENGGFAQQYLFYYIRENNILI